MTGGPVREIRSNAAIGFKAAVGNQVRRTITHQRVIARYRKHRRERRNRAAQQSQREGKTGRIRANFHRLSFVPTLKNCRHTTDINCVREFYWNYSSSGNTNDAAMQGVKRDWTGVLRRLNPTAVNNFEVLVASRLADFQVVGGYYRQRELLHKVPGANRSASCKTKPVEGAGQERSVGLPYKWIAVFSRSTVPSYQDGNGRNNRLADHVEGFVLRSAPKQRFTTRRNFIFPIRWPSPAANI